MSNASMSASMSASLNATLGAGDGLVVAWGPFHEKSPRMRA